MKFTTRFFSLAIALMVLSTSSVFAASLVSETFTYADGGLVGKDPAIGGVWGTHSGTTLPVQVAGGQISVLQASTAGEDVNIPYEGGFVLGAGGSLYSGFDLTVPTPSGAFTPSYFAMFLTGTSSFDARIWVAAPTTSGFRLGFSNDNSITDADGEVFTGDLLFDTKYRIVSKYDFTAQRGTLWINPVDESSTSIVALDPGFSDASTAYAFRQAAPATGSITQVIDNLAVGTTFADAITVVPEPSTFVLAGFAVVGLVGVARRRKSA